MKVIQDLKPRGWIENDQKREFARTLTLEWGEYLLRQIENDLNLKNLNVLGGIIFLIQFRIEGLKKDSETSS